MNMRDYQGDCRQAIHAAFARGLQSVMSLMATGTGKTILAAYLANDFLPHGRVFAVMHRNELIRQAASKFTAVTHVVPAIEKAEERSDESDDSMHGKAQIVVASFQTLSNKDGELLRRLHKFEPKEFAFLWIDECHHLPAPTYRIVVDYFRQGNPDIKILGVTATGDRADGVLLGDLFQEIAFEYSLPRAIEDGWLVGVNQRSVKIDGLDFSKVHKLAGGDFNRAELETAMLYEKPLHGVVHATIEAACGLDIGAMATLKDDEHRAASLAKLIGGNRRRKTIVFAVNIEHAVRIAEIINRWIPQSAVSIDSKNTSDEDRPQILRDFAHGEFQFLVNVGIATEGFDEPGVEVVSIARPTMSRALYTQMIGRGTRPLRHLADGLGDLLTADERRKVIVESEKPFVIVLDFVGNAGKHKLVSAADILGDARYDDAVIERAKELAEEEMIDVEEALGQAEEEIEAEQEANRALAEIEDDEEKAAAEQKLQREIARRMQLVGVADYRVREVDPFDLSDRHAKETTELRRGGCTDKQIDLLVGLGVSRDRAARCHRKEASTLIDKLMKDRCTNGQRGLLRRFGYTDDEVDGMNFDSASAAIDAAKRRRGAA
jgi:superfamily II DNA or RNA helicase